MRRIEVRTDWLVAAAVVVFSALLLFAAAAMAQGEDESRAYCAEEWPGDYVMQEYCVDQQLEATRDYFSWVAAHVPGMNAAKTNRELTQREFAAGHRATSIAVKCWVEWTDKSRSGPDWVMVWHCTERQAESLAKLGEDLGGYDRDSP